MSGTSEPLDFPSGAVAKLSIIETGTRLSGFPIAAFFGPPLKGFDVFPPLPAWSFLVESPTGRKAVFDLAVSKNLKNTPPAIFEQIKQMNAQIDTPKDVAQVLREGGVSLDSIESIVWSHWHVDHIGDPSTFPDSTEIVVGPRAKEAVFPTYPENEASTIHESILKGKSIREVSFDGSLKLYGLDALDFFGDGSFYLINMPGHTLGHIGGLVRTTSNPDTFAVLSGDLYHSPGEFRPSAYKPLPKEVLVQFPYHNVDTKPRLCLCSVFDDLQVKRGRTIGQPFFEVINGHDVEAANDSLKKSQLPDANNNLIFFSAHDDSLAEVADFFPKLANDWKALEWKEQIYWTFLKDLTKAIDVHD